MGALSEDGLGENLDEASGHEDLDEAEGRGVVEGLPRVGAEGGACVV